MNSTVLSIGGRFAGYIDFLTKKQLLDRKLWKKCFGVFGTDTDDRDDGWRGEYWGKMMRGACLIYSVTHDSELYDTLTFAVRGLLSRQEKNGRISTYSPGHEFLGWDMWARKYIITGLQHYCDICTDEILISEINAALKAHADYITDRIGKNKKEILDTGSFWGGVNSASILEPFVRLYADTGDKKYLSFAEYIVSTGGCRDGNLIEAAQSGKAPFEFPEQKAYETISFFEGLLALYGVTGEKKYLDTVTGFCDRMLETDFTVIGGCGCTHELFDNSSVMQTVATGKIMHETCVTVTIMRFLARLYLVTGEKKLTDAIRLAGLNVLAGALNINGYPQFSNERKQWLDGLVFDSYSPVCDSQRALGIGGFKCFADGSHFGCCACIAAAGFAVYPLMSVTQNGETITVNYLTEIEKQFRVNETDVSIKLSENEITVKTGAPAGFTLRVTTGDEYCNITAKTSCKTVSQEGGYTVIKGFFNGEEKITLENTPLMTETVLNGKTHLNYGGFALAADTAVEKTYTAGRHIEFLRDENGNVIYELLPREKGEQLRIKAATTDGGIILTDYAAAGQDGKSTVSVWFA